MGALPRIRSSNAIWRVRGEADAKVQTMVDSWSLYLKDDFLRAIDGHILAGGLLVGEFVPQVVRTN